MRHPWMMPILILALAAPALAGGGPAETFDWGPWRRLPVLEGGRTKPLDTVARETRRLLGHQTRYTDARTGQRLDATGLYLTWLFAWPGWDRAGTGHACGQGHAGSPPGCGQDGHDCSPSADTTDSWDRTPLLRADFPELREALGVPAGERYVAPAALRAATIRKPHSGREVPFAAWAETLLPRQGELSLFERKALELAARLWTYQDLRAGSRLEVIPVPGSDEQSWISLAQLTQRPWNDQTDPTGQLRQAREQFNEVRAAFRQSPEAFNRASAEFLALLQSIGPEFGEYPSQAVIDLEVGYNAWAPFRLAWILMLAALVSLLLAMGSGWRTLYAAGLAGVSASLVAMLAGFTMRMIISGRVPVANMYESVIYVGFGAAVFGLLFELIHRKQYVLTAAAAVATLALILADNAPAQLDPTLRPLAPVLRSNFWLATHVLSITLSYSAFALALGMSNVTLGYYCARSPDREAIAALSQFTYRALQVGVVLLAAGTVLGGIWADYSWGRFWGWDPKEVWSLITLLGYMAILHARYVRWVHWFGLAVSSIFGFFLVMMTWYGVNFVLGSGLHSYGFGSGGGQGYVAAALGLQSLWVLFVAIWSIPTRAAVAAPVPSRARAAARPAEMELAYEQS